jgi:hypothetical protein
MSIAASHPSHRQESLKDMFCPEWSESDLEAVLLEVDGDLVEAISRIADGKTHLNSLFRFLHITLIIRKCYPMDRRSKNLKDQGKKEE